MPDSQNDQPHECENEKQKHKTGQAGYNIVQIHISGVRDSLPDLDRKGEHDQHCEHIDPRDYEYMMSGEGDEQRIDQQEHSHAQQAHDDKMQLFVCQKKSGRIIQRQDLVVYPRHSAYHII